MKEYGFFVDFYEQFTIYSLSLWAASSSMNSLCLRIVTSTIKTLFPFRILLLFTTSRKSRIRCRFRSGTAFRSLSNLVFRSRVRLQCMLALNSITFKLEFNAYLTYSSPHRLKTLSCPRSIYRSSLLPFVFSPSSSNDNDTPPTLNILGQQHYSLAILLAD
jgi:hypothetical protein